VRDSPEEVSDGQIQTLESVAQRFLERDGAGVLFIAGGTCHLAGAKAASDGGDEQLIVEDEIIPEVVERDRCQKLP
jgi:hypothetical protein